MGLKLLNIIPGIITKVLRLSTSVYNAKTMWGLQENCPTVPAHYIPIYTFLTNFEQTIFSNSG